LELTKLLPVLWLERVPEMQLLHLGLGGHEGFFSPFLQTSMTSIRLDKNPLAQTCANQD
jgi:hypothetical protein